MTNTAEFRDLTTLRVGGSISDFREPATRADLIETFRDVSSGREPWFLLGGGSNIVVSDEPFDGTVIRVTTRGIDQHTDGDRVLVTAQAGEPWDTLVKWTVDNGLAGLEALSGIPGTVGGAPIQNIGAYGAELADTFESLQFVPPRRGDVVTLRRDALNFGYRQSSLKDGLEGLVVSVTFALTPSETSTPIRFDQLANALGVPLGATVALAEIRRAVLELRASKGMVISDDPDSVSVGSFFTNPVVPVDQFERMQADAEAPIPNYPAPDGVKIAAGWLVEQAGFGRGFPGEGPCRLSTKHALALTNRGGATTADVLALARTVRDGVHAAFGVWLVPEPVLVGCEL